MLMLETTRTQGSTPLQEMTSTRDRVKEMTQQYHQAIQQRDRRRLCEFWFVAGLSRCRLPFSWPVFFLSETPSAWLVSLGSSWRLGFVQRPSWCLGTPLAFFHDILLCPRTHDVVPVAANRSSAWWVARTMSSNHGTSPFSCSLCGTLSKEGVAVSVLVAFFLLLGGLAG